MELETEPRLDNIKFRFKTKKELIAEFGTGWNRDNTIRFHWSDTGDMDYLFGSVVPDKYQIETFKMYIGLIDSVCIPRKHGDGAWYFKKSVITYKLLEV